MLVWLNEHRAILHLLLHALLPAAIAMGLLWVKQLQDFRLRLLPAWFVRKPSGVYISIFTCLMLTMAVDIDHLVAVPIYAPNRCSIFFHPLHQTWAISGYVMIFSWLCLQAWQGKSLSYSQKLVGLFALGLIIHMVLDAVDCVWMTACA